ncbi:MAG: leucine-rich repeat domain-containing protein [Promethearchaeota archaeon]
MSYVILDEEKYDIKGGKLDLNSKNIENITEIRGLKTFSDLQVLYLNKNKIKEINGLKHLNKLKVLALSDNLITEIKGLESNIDLEWLNLRSNQITELRNLASLSNLKILNLRDNRITEIKGLESLTNLQELILTDNQIAEIRELRYLSDLQEIDLKNNLITEIKGLENLTKLQQIDMTNNQIFEIKGLENLTNLQELVLADNKISEIKGLENLTRLRVLNLSNNQITDVRGLESLTNLKFLNLKGNPISYRLLRELDGFDQKGNAKKPQKFVEYCQYRLEEERKKVERIWNNTIQYIKKSSSIYSEITLDKISSKTGIQSKNLESLIENMIYNKEIDAQIRGNLLIFKKQVIKPKLEPKLEEMPKLSQFLDESIKKNVKVLRGGDWKIEANQSVFNYKVKIKNLSKYIISDIQVIFGDIPPGLELRMDKLIEFSKLNPNSEVAPTYKLYATDNCVGSEIKGIVNYNDHFGQMHTVQIEPFEICYVCNLLVPRRVSREEFENTIQNMEGRIMHIDSNMDPYKIEALIKRKMEECNFALLKEITEAQQNGFRKIEGLAQGLYDKQDVAISIAMKKLEEGSDIEIKTLSDKVEKTTDLLKDISIKIEDIKSDTQKVQDIIYYLDESKIRETLSIVIENPKDLNRVIYKVIKNPNWSDEEKDKWAKIVMETLNYYKMFKTPLWLKFLKGITKITLGEPASRAITAGVEELVDWLNLKIAKRHINK